MVILMFVYNSEGLEMKLLGMSIPTMLEIYKRRSLTESVFGLNGYAISWKTTVQSTVTLSTTEAEYMTVTKTLKKVLWLKELFGKLRDDLQVSTVFCDIQSVIYLKKD